MDFEVIMALIGLTVAATAAILGIWMERDPTKPPRYAYALSILILMATGVGMFQSWNDHQDNEKMKEDMARVLQMLDKISQTAEVDNPELAEFVKSEVSAQSRANPSVVKKLAQRVVDDGGDATDVLGSYLPAAEVEGLQRQGKLKTKPPVAPRPPPAAARGPGPNGDTKEPGRPRRQRTRYGEKRADMAPPPPAPKPAVANARDRDGDGIADKDEKKKPKDSDGDGIPDKDEKKKRAKDSDGDGIADKDEKKKLKDKDGDGKPDKPKHGKPKGK